MALLMTIDDATKRKQKRFGTRGKKKGNVCYGVAVSPGGTQRKNPSMWSSKTVVQQHPSMWSSKNSTTPIDVILKNSTNPSMWSIKIVRTHRCDQKKNSTKFSELIDVIIKNSTKPMDVIVINSTRDTDVTWSSKKGWEGTEWWELTLWEGRIRFGMRFPVVRESSPSTGPWRRSHTNTLCTAVRDTTNHHSCGHWMIPPDSRRADILLV